MYIVYCSLLGVFLADRRSAWQGPPNHHLLGCDEPQASAFHVDTSRGCPICEFRGPGARRRRGWKFSCHGPCAQRQSKPQFKRDSTPHVIRNEDFDMANCPHRSSLPALDDCGSFSLGSGNPSLTPVGSSILPCWSQHI